MKAICNRKQLLIRAYKGRASVYLLIGESAKTIEDCKKALSYYAKNTGANSSLKADIAIDFADAILRGESEYNIADARQLVEDMLKTIKRKRDFNSYVQGLNALGNTYWYAGEYDKALKIYTRAVAISKKTNNQRVIARLYGNIGNIYLGKGELNIALQYYKKFLEVSEKMGDKMGVGGAAGSIGVIYGTQGKLDAALIFFKKDMVISEEIGHKRGIGTASGNIGVVYGLKGELDTALRYYRQYYTISKETGFKHGLGIASCNIGHIYFSKGDIDMAFECYKTYLFVSEELNDKTGIGIACAYIGGILINKSRLDNARKYLERAKEILIKTGAKKGLSLVYRYLADLSLRRKNRKALVYARKALLLAEEMNSTEDRVPALRIVGQVLSGVDVAKAMAYLKQSIAIAEKENMRLELAQSLFELARMFQIVGKKRAAYEILLRAKQIFKKSGARLWLRRVGCLRETLNKYRTERT